MTRSPSTKRWWWIATGAYALLTFIVSVIPLPRTPSIPHLDKVAHLCHYLLFAWLLVQAVRATRLDEREYRLMAWIYATSYGLLMEVIQAMVPWRSADWLDALANAIGAAIGVWIGGRLPRPHEKGRAV